MVEAVVLWTVSRGYERGKWGVVPGEVAGVGGPAAKLEEGVCVCHGEVDVVAFGGDADVGGCEGVEDEVYCGGGGGCERCERDQCGRVHSG